MALVRHSVTVAPRAFDDSEGPTIWPTFTGPGDYDYDGGAA